MMSDKSASTPIVTFVCMVRQYELHVQNKEEAGGEPGNEATAV